MISKQPLLGPSNESKSMSKSQRSQLIQYSKQCNKYYQHSITVSDEKEHLTSISQSRWMMHYETEICCSLFEDGGVEQTVETFWNQPLWRALKDVHFLWSRSRRQWIPHNFHLISAFQLVTTLWITPRLRVSFVEAFDQDVFASVYNALVFKMICIHN